MCQDRARLLEACEQWEERFSESLAEHCGKGGLVDHDGYQHLRNAVESAAVGLNFAKAELGAHESLHGCELLKLGARG